MARTKQDTPHKKTLPTNLRPGAVYTASAEGCVVSIPSSPLPPCMRPKDAAAFLQIGLSTLWKWAKEGKVPAPVRMGGRCTVWLRADLEAYLGLDK